MKKILCLIILLSGCGVELRDCTISRKTMYKADQVENEYILFLSCTSNLLFLREMYVNEKIFNSYEVKDNFPKK